MSTDDCFICRKQRGEIAAPPGGYLWEDETWLVCHAPAEIAAAGTVILESRRHVLDFQEMPADDEASVGRVLSRLYPAIKRATGTERVYLLATIGAVPHFHLWLVPWPEGSALRGPAFLAAERSCTPSDAVAAAERIRAALAPA